MDDRNGNSIGATNVGDDVWLFCSWPARDTGGSLTFNPKRAKELAQQIIAAANRASSKAAADE